MKSLKTMAFAALLLACYGQASAQKTTLPLNEPNYSKPKLFADLPEKAPLRIANLEDLFNLKVGANAATFLTDGFAFTGTVVSTSSPADTTVKSIVINSLSRLGSTFTLTRITASDGTVSYLGRILSKAGGDALEITKEGDQYIINKKNLNELINE